MFGYYSPEMNQGLSVLGERTMHYAKVCCSIGQISVREWWAQWRYPGPINESLARLEMHRRVRAAVPEELTRLTVVQSDIDDQLWLQGSVTAQQVCERIDQAHSGGE